ncbi:hypothetical protein [Wenjunlia tyrosinilytica]|uniref:Peptidase MA superfamily protein n=1 Tax=Wenjunlia tyrosinilytica TaxID=1544741 RepID=A0A917ZH14_9ACTN|nr:hypothetical protein [Wenjunlia tyrosinilytica]GGO81994.1 hypothetical protein GCM10012280_07590 [Wenjunlia tyrosinilytica]
MIRGVIGHGENGPGGRATRRFLFVALGTVLALILALLLGDRSGAGSTPSPDAAVESLLQQRAHAVLTRNEGAFLATVDPAAAAFRARERAWFANVADVPLASWEYRVDRLQPRAARRVGADVRLGYRIKGYDREPVTSTEHLTLAQRDGRWRITAEREGVQQLWDFGRVHTVRGERSLVLGLDNPRTLRGYADDADRAVPAVNSVWKGRWSGRVVLEVPRSLGQMARLLGAPPATYRGIAAVTTGETGGSAAAPADRVIVNPEAFRVLTRLGRRVVIAHETTHVATRAFTTPRTPLWLSEGAADWVGYLGTGRTPEQIAPELTADVRAGKVPGRLPSNVDFGTTRQALAQSYEMAWFACRLIADEYGRDRLVELYKRVGRKDEGGVDTVMRAVLGVSLEQFTKQWRAEIVRELT